MQRACLAAWVAQGAIDITPVSCQKAAEPGPLVLFYGPNDNLT